MSQTEFNVFISAFLINRLILLFHDSSILQMMPLLLAMIDDALTYQYSPQPHNLSLLLLHSYNVCFKKKKKKTTSHWLHYMIMTMQVLFTDKTTKLWNVFFYSCFSIFFPGIDDCQIDLFTFYKKSIIFSKCGTFFITFIIAIYILKYIISIFSSFDSSNPIKLIYFCTCYAFVRLGCFFLIVLEISFSSIL